jgi:hypothetical protein
MNDRTFLIPNVGVLVEGAPDGPRKLVLWRDILTAYADLELDTDREAYLSHFVFTIDMIAHYKANGRSVRGYAGPCWARWVVVDIDNADLAAALSDTRKLVALLIQRFPGLDGCVPVYFSGAKGFHVYLDLAHEPPPAVGFNMVCRTLAEDLAAAAGVRVDVSIYDVNHLIRLPNSRHPRTGLFKRRIETEALFRLDAAAIRDLANVPAGDGLSTVGDRVPELEDAWNQAAAAAARQVEARAVNRRQAAAAVTRAPRYVLDFLRFGVPEGERRPTLFRCAAWMAEQGAPDRLIHAMLTEAALDLGVTPKDVARQIDCGIAHARRQGGKEAAA